MQPAPRQAPAQDLKDARPGRRLFSSQPLGWTALRVEALESRGSVDAFETPAFADQTLVVVTQGRGEIECFSGGRWRKARYETGDAGLTPSGQTSRLRWQPLGPDIQATLHLHLPDHFFAEAREEYRRAGSPSKSQPLNALSFTDPVVARVAQSLSEAVQAGAPELYAQSATRFLAMHLLSAQSGWAAQSRDRRDPGTLKCRRLALVLEYMNAHYGDPLSLDRLAAEAGVSAFHFVRLFKKGVGITPHRHLVRLRMDAAASLLTTTDWSILEIALECGYQSQAHFTAAFRKHFSKPPSLCR